MAIPSFETSWPSRGLRARGNSTALTRYVSVVKGSRFPSATKSFPGRNTGRIFGIAPHATASCRTRALQSIGDVNTTGAWCCVAAGQVFRGERGESAPDRDERENICTCSNASTSGEKGSRTLPGVGHNRSRKLCSWTEKQPTGSSGIVRLSSMYYINEKNVLENDAACALSLPIIEHGHRTDVRLLRHILKRERHSIRTEQRNQLHSRQSAPSALAKPNTRLKLYTGEGNVHVITYFFNQYGLVRYNKHTLHSESLYTMHDPVVPTFLAFRLSPNL